MDKKAGFPGGRGMLSSACLYISSIFDKDPHLLLCGRHCCRHHHSKHPTLELELCPRLPEEVRVPYHLQIVNKKERFFSTPQILLIKYFNFPFVSFIAVSGVAEFSCTTYKNTDTIGEPLLTCGSRVQEPLPNTTQDSIWKKVNEIQNQSVHIFGGIAFN